MKLNTVIAAAILVPCLLLSAQYWLLTWKMNDMEDRVEELNQAIIWNQSLLECFMTSSHSECSRRGNP